MRLADITTTDAAEVIDTAEVALLPTGSTEQHGPALPLSTDAVTAESIASRLDRDDVVQLPTIPIGISEHHRQFDGTLWLTEETFESAVRETVTSIASHGMKKVVIVNGHGGNTAAITRAARRLRNEEIAFAAPWNWWEGIPESLPERLFDEGGGHADAGESSIMLHLRKDLVDREALEAAETDGSDDWGHSVAGADVGFDTIDFSASGATGKPTQASAGAGCELIDTAADSLDDLVDWLAEQPVADLWAKPHK